jgi:hypothetical protein
MHKHHSVHPFITETLLNFTVTIVMFIRIPSFPLCRCFSFNSSYMDGDGSKHIRPNQASEVHVVELDDRDTVACDVGEDVIETVRVVEVRSWQPQKSPGVSQLL